MDITRRYVLAVTGATGAPFAGALLKRMISDHTVEQIVLLSSLMGRRCFFDETGVALDELAKDAKKITIVEENNLGAEISSGSALYGGMAVVPCSMGTLGRIASGTSDNLIIRAADVCLKERRPLVLCIREAPLNRIQIENMLVAHDAGAVVMPLAPAFYHGANSIEGLCDAFAIRIMDQLGLLREDSSRWKG